MALVARSNRAGQAKFIGVDIDLGWLIVRLTESWICLTGVGEALDLAWRILVNYGQLGDQFICRVNRQSSAQAGRWLLLDDQLRPIANDQLNASKSVRI